MAASRVEPERGSPEMKWIPCCIALPAERGACNVIA
jgi:hypothetical protein